MSSSNDLNDPIFRLGLFTPDLGGFDRDALLFAAGKTSAKPNRFWIAIAGILLVSQSITLVLLLQSKEPVVATPGIRSQSTSEIPPISPSTESPRSDLLIRLNDLDKMELPYRPPSVEHVSSSGSRGILSVHSRTLFE